MMIPKFNILKKVALGAIVGIVFVSAMTQTINAQEKADNKTFKEVEEQLFPGWKSDTNLSEDDKSRIGGVIGEQKDDIRIFQYIPRIADLLLKIVAPIVVVLVLYAGVRLIIGGEDSEERDKAKNFFIYALIGLAFIVLSYSIMKTVYSLLS